MWFTAVKPFALDLRELQYKVLLSPRSQPLCVLEVVVAMSHVAVRASRIRYAKSLPCLGIKTHHWFHLQDFRVLADTIVPL